jgi:hypothetical protein
MSSIGPVSGDPMVGLAVLMIENADRLGDLEQQRLDAAREAMERASRAEVEALHDAADAVATGALVQGGLTFVGGAVSCGATLNGAGVTHAVDGGVAPTNPNANAAQKLGDSLGGSPSSLAGPMGTLTGEVPRRHAEAEAATFRQQGERASMDAEDARARLRREEQQADAVLNRTGQILEIEAQGNLAILGNF